MLLIFFRRYWIDGKSSGTTVQNSWRNRRAQVRFRVGRRIVVRGQMVQRERGVLPVRAQVETAKNVLRRGRDQSRRECHFHARPYIIT